MAGIPEPSASTEKTWQTNVEARHRATPEAIYSKIPGVPFLTWMVSSRATNMEWTEMSTRKTRVDGMMPSRTRKRRIRKRCWMEVGAPVADVVAAGRMARSDGVSGMGGVSRGVSVVGVSGAPSRKPK